MGLLIDGVWSDESALGRIEQGRYKPVPQLDHARWRARPFRQWWLFGGGRTLSPLCFARLPLGASHHDHARAQGA